jgi:nucleoside-diphosphate-sugar epimerase
VKELLFLGSNCVYPKLAPQPVKEQTLLTSELELTNQWYAIAKIAGIKLCEAYSRQYGVDYFAVMPTDPVRTRRQLPSGEQPRRRWPDSPDPRGEGRRGRFCGRVEHRNAAARVPLCQ